MKYRETSKAICKEKPARNTRGLTFDFAEIRARVFCDPGC